MKQLIALLIGLVNLSSFAQQSADSLWTIYQDKSQNDSIRIDAFVQFTEDSETDSLLHLIDEFISESNNGNRRFEVVGERLKGNYFQSQSKYKIALGHFEKSLHLASQRETPYDLAYCNLALGKFYAKRRKRKSSLEHCQNALNYSRGQVDSGLMINIHYWLAQSLILNGKLAKAETHLHESRKFAAESGEQVWEQQITYFIASVSFMLQNFKPAHDYALLASDLAREMGDDTKYYKSLSLYAEIIYLQQKYEECHEIFDQCIAHFEDIQSTDDKNDALLEKAEVFLMQKNADEALKIQQEVEAFYKDSQDRRRYANAKCEVARTYTQMNKNKEAIDAISEAITIFKEEEMSRKLASSYLFITRPFYNLGQYDSTIHYGNLALEILPKSAIVQEIHLRMILMRSYAGLDMVDESLKELDLQAELLDRQLKDVFAYMAEEDKERYMDYVNGYRDAHNSFLMSYQEEDPSLGADCYNQAIVLKGILLSSTFAVKNSILESDDPELLEKYDQWVTYKKMLGSRTVNGMAAKVISKRALKLERELVDASSEFKQLEESTQLTYKEVKRTLNKEEAAIEFVRFIHYENQAGTKGDYIAYGALILRKDSDYPEFQFLFKEQELRELLGTISGNDKSFVENLYGTLKNKNSQLHELIWKPLEPSLEGIKTIHYSPVGLLHKISFAALSDSSGTYLIDKYEMNELSNTAKLTEESRTNVALSNIGIMGGVDYNRSKSNEQKIWSYLDGTLAEVRTINELVQKKSEGNKLLTGKEATEEKFKEIAPSSTTLHIATHGFFFPDPDLVENSMVDEDESDMELDFRGTSNSLGMETFLKSKSPLQRSGLALAGANDVWNESEIEGEDGVLTAAEVSHIDMRKTELVVLSACETGLGDIKLIGSEGVYGLQRSFKMAGVNKLIMSLWQVPDKETSEFMITFYELLTKTNDINRSFRETQRLMRDKYDPYFWAAFVLIE